MAAQTAAEGEQQEAEQYWGYLISPDRTGTDNFKRLLRGLHNHISTTFDPYDSSDLTPKQLARFYKACNGDYDQLFIRTPPSDIAFIYKNLGCSHSLQPLPISPTDPRYSDPVIPALKVEGWIVWSTIQLLLAPDEHADFLRQAVKTWDVKIPGTTDVFPKIIPRSCFPTTPDPTMQAWYDGMTERLRKEMEAEENHRIKAADDDRPDSPMHKHYPQHRIRHVAHSYDSDEDSATEAHRHDALAYFRNPLFRTVDGRPGVVRRPSKRPGLDPRQSFVQRGKTAAATVGRVVQNVASPHLWNGHPSSKHVQDAETRRRRSLPDKNRYHDDELEDSPTGPHSRHHDRHSRRGSHQGDTPPSDHTYWTGGGEDIPRRTHSQRAHLSPDLHHRRSHDPPASPREYFPPPTNNYDGAAGLHTHGTHRRNSSAHPDLRSGSPAQGGGVGGGFVPSASPLFATHVARGENPAYPYRTQSRPPLQRRADYRSPERPGAGTTGSRPSSGREDWDGSDSGSGGTHRSGSGSIGHGPRGVSKTRGPTSRYGTPVGSAGVDGRRYAAQGDMAYRGGR